MDQHHWRGKKESTGVVRAGCRPCFGTIQPRKQKRKLPSRLASFVLIVSLISKPRTQFQFSAAKSINLDEAGYRVTRLQWPPMPLVINKDAPYPSLWNHRRQIYLTVPHGFNGPQCPLQLTKTLLTLAYGTIGDRSI